MVHLQKIFGQLETKEQFDALRISIASPEEIKKWSHGEVTKPETINYHSLKPEADGLFCQKIFGPVKDFECACGRYKRAKFKGVVCERCGVEVGSSNVRREYFGHIKLAIPVAHTWFLREGKIATLLDNLPQKKLEQVISYDAYIITEPALTSLKKYQVISEEEFQKAVEEFGEDAFHYGIGAEGIREIFSKLDMGDERTRLRALLEETKSEAKRKGIIKQLKLVESLLDSGTKPEWMLPDILPVTPPDMRPLVTLDAGHVAASDLNDLYRRVIIRNNRLKRFMEMHAPDIIVRNEKRMLQEAVDSLFDNEHKARPMVSQNRRPLKSLSGSLHGKSGRFRMNMLGKRVDYSGRSVITPGPTLRMHQVGLPKTMALELFKPFVFAKLMAGDYANTIKAARKMVENGDDRVWEILEQVIYQHPVLLNRAPSLHRLSLLAFEPVLIEGKAIRLHPLVCKGFNADFDGDQMSVHVPISLEAQLEARTLMLATNNVLSPANGEPMTVPSQDMVLGVYYISLVNGEWNEKSPRFSGMDEIKLALENKTITLHTPIYARVKGKTYETTAGRMILGELLPEGMHFDSVNKKMPAGEIKKLLAKTYEVCGDKAMILLADALKDTGFEQAVRSGISIGFDDIVIPEEKQTWISDSEKKAAEIEKQYQNGLISSGERKNKLIDLWQHTTDELGNLSFAALGKTEGDKWNSIYMMADSKARGSKAQIQQLAGMRGMMARPDGSIIEVPIISNFKEGLTMSEYFTSTHGARKGMSDTALKTATAGYLTRRLVDLAINTVITEHDCGTHECITAKPVYQGTNVSVPLGDVILGRTAAKDIKNPVTGEVIVKEGDLVTKAAARQINELHDAGLQSAEVRSVLTCQSDGLCAKCYGMDLSRNALVHVGEPVGLIAGQSVGEPGTQLTLRTFHIGGIAEAGTSEYAIPQDGIIELQNVKITENSDHQIVVLNNEGEIILYPEYRIIKVTDKAELKVKDNDTVKKDDILFVANDDSNKKEETKSPFDGKVRMIESKENGRMLIVVKTAIIGRKWKAKKNLVLTVKDGKPVKKGTIIANEYNMNAIVANEDGVVSYNDLEENVSYQEEVDNTTGIGSKKVIDWKGKSKRHLNPAILLVNNNGEIVSTGKKKAEYLLPTFATITVENGKVVKAGDVLARVPVQTTKAGDITGGLPRVEELLEVRRPSNPAVLAEKDGVVELEDAKSKVIIRIEPDDGTQSIDCAVPKGSNILVRSGDHVKKADKLVAGEIVPQDILRILGQKELAQFMVEQVQQVYRLQGVAINDKHIEILIREMTRRVEISNPGDTAFISGSVVDRVDFEEENERVRKDGGRVAEASQVLVGLTRASLTSRSFISNASFQQTTKVLVDAAISGATDRLLGVNENLIVGRLIPIGTGAYVRRVREIAKEEEKAEKLAHDGGGEQQMLNIK